MKPVLLLAAALAAGAPAYQIDLGRYFPDPAAEQTQRTSLMARVDAFAATPASSLAAPEALAAWLAGYDALLVELRRHDAYVYLRAEEDSADHADEAADGALGSAMDKIDAAAGRTLAAIGPVRLKAMMAGDPALARYRHFIQTTVDLAAHAARNRQEVEALAVPALQSLVDSYKSLLPPRPLKPEAAPGGDAEAAFEAKWSPYLRNEDAFAAVLLPIVHLRDGEARLQGWPGAPEAAYGAAGLTAAEVNAALAAVRRTGAAKRYDAVVAAAAARRLNRPLSAVHAWDLPAADASRPAAVAFPDSIPIILAAVRPMGADYAGQYARLLDPRAHRVEWCQASKCDDAGFSVGFSGVESGLFYGSYRGDPNSLRAVAHEAGHAVHRQFMNEHQTLAVYNEGPHFVFESFAIFNELLLLDHLYKTAPTPAAKAYYLHKFLDDVTFQIYGSAQETDLEQSIYAGVRAGAVRSAPDLDALTMKVFARYRSGAVLDPQMRVYWARDRLYFTDPLYDANYLFAGLLAVRYLQQYETDPKGFSKRYVALLENGFTASPQVLERRFLGIDLDDPGHLVQTATSVIDQRTAELDALYRRRPG